MQVNIVCGHCMVVCDDMGWCPKCGNYESVPEEEAFRERISGHNFTLHWDEDGKYYRCSRCGVLLGKENKICEGKYGNYSTDKKRFIVSDSLA